METARHHICIYHVWGKNCICICLCNVLLLCCQRKSNSSIVCVRMVRKKHKSDLHWKFAGFGVGGESTWATLATKCLLCAFLAATFPPPPTDRSAMHFPEEQLLYWICGFWAFEYETSSLGCFFVPDLAGRHSVGTFTCALSTIQWIFRVFLYVYVLFFCLETSEVSISTNLSEPLGECRHAHIETSARLLI